MSEKKVNINELLNLGTDNLISKTNVGNTVYKESLFTGLNKSEKKSLRIKLRRRKEAFIKSAVFYNIKKDITALEKLKKDWELYAKNIYNDINVIVNNNAKEDAIKDSKQFLLILDSIDTKNNKVSKK